MGSTKGRVMLLILAVALIASLAYAVSMNQEKVRIADAYEEARNTLSQLEHERSSLIEELAGSQDELKDLNGVREELQRWKSELGQTQTKLEQTQAELASLQVEFAQLRNTNTSLVDQLNQTTEEKQALEAKFSNIDELKGAIRQIKREMWASRMQAWREHVRAEREEDLKRLEEGNRGFVVRDGMNTLGSTSRVHVRVLEPESAENPVR